MEPLIDLIKNEINKKDAKVLQFLKKQNTPEEIVKEMVKSHLLSFECKDNEDKKNQ